MEDPQSMDTPGQPADQPVTIMDEVNAQQMIFGPGVAQTINVQENASITKSGALSIQVGKDLTMADAGALAIPVGGDLEMTNGGALVMPVGGSAEINSAVAGIMPVGGNAELTDSIGVLSMSNEVTAKDSFLGVVISRQANIAEGSRVLLNTKQAAVFGAAAGAVFALLSWLLRKK